MAVFGFVAEEEEEEENSGLPFCERCSHHITFGSGLIDDPSPSLVLLLLFLDDMTTACAWAGRNGRAPLFLMRSPVLFFYLI